MIIIIIINIINILLMIIIINKIIILFIFASCNIGICLYFFIRFFKWLLDSQKIQIVYFFYFLLQQIKNFDHKYIQILKNCQQISAINIHSETITKDTINKSLDFTDTEIIIDECSFSDCNRGDKDNLNGGAIYYECSNGELTVHGTIFENCDTNEVQFLPLVKKSTTNILIKI